ncbi:hypothetical protein N9J35_01175 [bacterium]|jgi:hypothetical protein|nr:hypothetical protein [bacterium]
MTSLNETLDTMLARALLELTKFARSPISDATFLQGYEYMLHYQSMLKQDDVFIDVLIDYSKTVRSAHLALQRLSAHHILHKKDMPHQLSVWLVDYLMGDYQMPTSGKRGPNKTEVRHIFLMQLVLKLRTLGNVRVHPPANDGPCVLDIISEAQRMLLKTRPGLSDERELVLTQIEKQRIKRLLPTSTSGLEALYKKALKESPHLKISFSEF